MTQQGRLLRGVVFLGEAAETSQRCVCAWFGRTDRTYTGEVEKGSQTGKQHSESGNLLLQKSPDLPVGLDGNVLWRRRVCSALLSTERSWVN